MATTTDKLKFLLWVSVACLVFTLPRSNAAYIPFQWGAPYWIVEDSYWSIRAGVDGVYYGNSIEEVSNTWFNAVAVKDGCTVLKVYKSSATEFQSPDYLRIGSAEPWGPFGVCTNVRTEPVSVSPICPEGTIKGFYYCTVQFHVVNLQDNPPPNECAGNPVEISKGKKYQSEIDIYAEGHGQVFLTRFISTAGSGSTSLWRHNYDKRIAIVDPVHSASSFVKQKSKPYDGELTACETGWKDISSQISESWAIGAVAIFKEGSCQIVKDNVVVKSLPLVASNEVYGSIRPSAVQLQREDGSTINFQSYGEAGFSTIAGDSGKLERIGSGNYTWRYSASNGDVEEYSSDGRLLSITASNGVKQTLSYDFTTNLLISVEDTLGGKLRFNYAANVLISVTTHDNKTTAYTYNTNGLISKVTRPNGTTRSYHYEDIRFPSFITGITDELGKRYATWTYDEQGQAISSEHAGGAERTLLSFNADGSTTVVNALNKKTIYRFADIAGARRVVKVEGQPTANCAGANQEYTYTPEGWLASKTDWKGTKTVYQYNALGQEISRTEAFGTTEARTITTEWHPTLYLKTRVTEPDKEITFSYDTKGLLVNKSIRSLTK